LIILPFGVFFLFSFFFSGIWQGEKTFLPFSFSVASHDDLFAGRKLPYPLDKLYADVAGRSFHNGRFVQRMREKASSLPRYVVASVASQLSIFPSTDLLQILFLFLVLL